MVNKIDRVLQQLAVVAVEMVSGQKLFLVTVLLAAAELRELVTAVRAVQARAMAVEATDITVLRAVVRNLLICGNSCQANKWIHPAD